MSEPSGKNDGNQDKDNLYRLDDPELDARIKSIMQADLELNAIRNDPYLEQARQEVASMMLSFDEMKRKDSSKEVEEFIKSSLGKKSSKEAREIKDIRIEISKSDINDLSAEWVREWHRKKQMQVSVTSADKERENFVKASLSENMPKQTSSTSPEFKVVTLQPGKTNKKAGNRRIIRLTTIAAAALLGAFIAIKSLIPSGNPEKIYQSFYNTYGAVTLTTRGANSSVAEIYNSGIAEYRMSKYSEAAKSFRRAASEDPSFGAPFFFLGLSQLETGNIDEAILSFNTAIKNPGNYSKELQWYLGLAYLKKNDKSKAAGCFRELASSEGYYRASAEKILRRLK